MRKSSRSGSRDDGTMGPDAWETQSAIAFRPSTERSVNYPNSKAFAAAPKIISPDGGDTK